MINNFSAIFLSYFSSVLDGIVNLYEPTEDLEHEVASFSWQVVKVSALIIVALVLLAWALNDKLPKLKLPLFIGIAGTMALSTLMLVGATVYLNTSSDSGGPVHWHADFEFWACGNELELRDPVGFSNKIGTWSLHEHDDRRIHLEGVVVDDEVDASLGKFMYVVGGTITKDALVVPLNPGSDLLFEDEVDGDGPSNSNPAAIDEYLVDAGDDGQYAKFINGGSCNGERAEVQVFVYQFNEDDDTYTQVKLDDPKPYVIYDDSNVPPGDCVIFEYDVPKEKTDKICEQYGVRDIDRCEQFGVLPEERSICTITQQDYDQNLNYQIYDESEATAEEVQGIQTYQQFLEELY